MHEASKHFGCFAQENSKTKKGRKEKWKMMGKRSNEKEDSKQPRKMVTLEEPN